MKRLHPKDDPAFLLPRQVGHATPAPRSNGPESPRMEALRAHAHSLGIFTWHQPEWLLEAAFARVRADEMSSAREAAEEIRGMPDLILFYKGRYMACEVKTEIGKLTAAQRRWMTWLNTVVVRDVTEGCQTIGEWKDIIDHA